MKKYVETIVVVLNENYEECSGFNSLELAEEEYQRIKETMFDDTAIEDVYEDGSKSITDDESELKMVLHTIECSDEEFKKLHPSSVAFVIS